MLAVDVKQPRVSIIIPVYNAEDYLDRCINSALQQTLSEIEVICVDDCSSDLSFSILKHRASQDRRLKILQHKENKGEGSARNTGLDAAGGEYILHLDADDTLPDDALEVLYQAAATNHSDLVKGCFAFVDPDGTIRQSDWSSPDTRIVNTNIHESVFLRKIPTSHCSYLYRREFLNTHAIRYGSDLVIGIDLVALARALLLAESVTLLPELVYFYHQSKQSATRGSMSARVPLDGLKALAVVSELLREAGFEAEANTRLQNWGYQINEYWQRMPDNLTTDQCIDVFTAFRQTVAVVEVPWRLGTPVHHKYLMGLVLLERDREALKFLRTETSVQGFSDEASLGCVLEFILSVAPDDPDTLMGLGRLAHRQGNHDRALSYFKNMLEKHPDHLGAKIQCSIVFREIGKYDDARRLLDRALEQCLEGTADSIAARHALAEKERLRLVEARKASSTLQQVIDGREREQSNLNKALDENRLELNKTRKESEKQLYLVGKRLAAVHSSTSWRITGPFRRFVRLVKKYR